MAACRRVKFLCRMFYVLVIRLRSLRLLRVSGIVMRLRMFLLLLIFLKIYHSFCKCLFVICKNMYSLTTSFVSPAYHLLVGFPFIQEPPSGDLQERVLIRHHDYDPCFQSVQLLQWNSQVKFNVTVYRNLPTTRDSIMTS